MAYVFILDENAGVLQGAYCGVRAHRVRTRECYRAHIVAHVFILDGNAGLLQGAYCGVRVHSSQSENAGVLQAEHLLDVGY